MVPSERRAASSSALVFAFPKLYMALANTLSGAWQVRWGGDRGCPCGRASVPPRRPENKNFRRDRSRHGRVGALEGSQGSHPDQARSKNIEN